MLGCWGGALSVSPAPGPALPTPRPGPPGPHLLPELARCSGRERCRGARGCPRSPPWGWMQGPMLRTGEAARPERRAWPAPRPPNQEPASSMPDSGCRAPGGQARCLGPAGWGPGSRARSRHRSRRALAGGSQAGEHMPATAGSSCPPPRELAQPVAIYVLEAGDMLPAKGPRGGRVAVCGPRHLCGHRVPVTATAGSARTRLQPGLAASSFAWQGVWPEGWASPYPLQAEGGLSGVGHWESRWVGVQAGGPGARRRGWVCKGGNGRGQQLPPLRGPVHQLMQEWAPRGASVRAPWGLSRKESGQRVRGRPGGGSERRAGVHWGPGRAWWAEWGAERGGIGDSDFACGAADHPGSSWGEGQAAGRDNEPALDPARMGTINPRGAGGRLLRWL